MIMLYFVSTDEFEGDPSSQEALQAYVNRMTGAKLKKYLGECAIVSAPLATVPGTVVHDPCCLYSNVPLLYCIRFETSVASRYDTVPI